MNTGRCRYCNRKVGEKHTATCWFSGIVLDWWHTGSAH